MEKAGSENWFSLTVLLEWRNNIGQKIDFPMLKRLVPVETVLKYVYAEMYDGKTTFCRQFEAYPLIIGVK